MLVWRITRKPFLGQVLAGIGAKKYGGRWNSKGTAVVYTSETLELAVLEGLVHLDIDLIPKDTYQVGFEVDEESVEPLQSSLPKGWGHNPPYDPKVQAIGDAWLKRGESLGLRVPASVLPSRCNILLNPAHPGINRIREIDRRPLPWASRVVEFLKELGEGQKESPAPRKKK